MRGQPGKRKAAVEKASGLGELPKLGCFCYVHHAETRYETWEKKVQVQEDPGFHKNNLLLSARKEGGARQMAWGWKEGQPGHVRKTDMPHPFSMRRNWCNTDLGRRRHLTFLLRVQTQAARTQGGSRWRKTRLAEEREHSSESLGGEGSTEWDCLLSAPKLRAATRSKPLTFDFCHLDVHLWISSLALAFYSVKWMWLIMGRELGHHWED